MNSNFIPRIVPLASGRVVTAFGDTLTIHLGGEETNGQFVLASLSTPPGSGTPIHYHENEDECFVPQSGRVEFYLNGEWNEVPMGTVVFLPRGTVHAFRNPGTEPLEMLLQTTPSGFDTFFSRCAEEFSRPGPLDMGRIVSISAEHGIYYPEQ